MIAGDIDKVRGSIGHSIVVHMKSCNGEKSMKQKGMLEGDLRNYSLPDLQMLWVVRYMITGGCRVMMHES